MELKQSLIHRNYEKCSAKNQLTLGDDFSVPDGKSDISSILQKKARLQIDEVHTEKGKIHIQGILKIWILYLADRSYKKADSILMEFPFDEMLYMEGAESGDHLKIDWEIENLRIGIIHPGKLSVRALVNFSAGVMGTEKHLVPENIEGSSGVYTKTETIVTAEPVFVRNDSYRIREEVVLPANKPNVQEMLWEDVQLRGMDVRIQDGKLSIKGEIQLFVLYEGEEDGQEIHWMEQTLPIHGSLDVTGLTSEMFGIVEHEIAHCQVEVKPDYDGELRMFQLEMMLNIHMHIYEERNCCIMKDAYSTKEILIPQVQEISYERLRMCNQAKCRVSGQERIKEEIKVLQILGHQAKLRNKRCKAVEQGIVCEGTLEVELLYVCADDKQPLGSMEVLIPYSQLIEIPEMGKEDTWKAFETLEQLFVSMQEGNRVEVRGMIGFHACVMQQCQLENITEFKIENYDMEEMKKSPMMKIYFVQPGESMWDIAKRHRSTVEDIKRVNELTREEVSAGQKLLLLKSAMETPIIL